MARRTKAAGLALALAGVLAPGRAEARPPTPRPNPRTGLVETPIDGLVAAVERGDRAEAERLAERIGVARVGRAVRDGDARTAAAAIEAAPLVPGAERLAGLVAERLDAATEEPRLAAAAARTLGLLLDGSAPDRFAEWEVPPDQVEAACGALHRAARQESPLALRLAALDAVAQVSRMCAAAGGLAPLLRDPLPAVRRAAVLALRPRNPETAAAIEALLRDPDPQVASAAAAASCRASDGPRRPPGEAVEAARRLAPRKDVPIEDAVEMLACLGTSHQPQDLKILDELRTGPPGPLRDRASEIAGQEPPSPDP